MHDEFKENLPLTSVLHTGGMIPSEKTKPARYRTESKLLILKDIVAFKIKLLPKKTMGQRRFYITNWVMLISIRRSMVKHG